MRWWSVMCNSGCVFLYSWSLDCKYIVNNTYILIQYNDYAGTIESIWCDLVVQGVLFEYVKCMFLVEYLSCKLLMRLCDMCLRNEIVVLGTPHAWKEFVQTCLMELTWDDVYMMVCIVKGCLCSFCNEKMHKWGDGIVLSYVLKFYIDDWFLFMLSPMTMLDELIGDTHWWVNGLYLNIVYMMVINMVYGGE